MRTARKINYLSIIAATAIVLGGASANAQTPVPTTSGGLQITGGTMQLGGGLAFRIDAVMPDEGDTTTGYVLGIEPSFGYFIIDGLEVVGNVGVDLSFGDLYTDSDIPIWFTVGARYVIDLGMIIYPYAGAQVGMRFDIPNEGDTTKWLLLDVPLGVMLALNEHVALDLGARVDVGIYLDDPGMTQLMVPIGYFGVEAFI
jgi:hypothetical protein